jgi:predicted RNA binding protein YcfA (HicA-like mRNA interferase family)
VTRAFERLGWVFGRRHGSHMILTTVGSSVSLSIPDHRERAPGTLRKLIRLSGATVEQFTRALRDS